MFNYLKKHNMRNSLKTLLCLTAICVFSNNAAAKICFLPDGNCGKTKININSGENGCIYKDKDAAETGMSKCEIAFQRNSCWWRRCNSDNKTIFDKLADCQKKIEDATKQECQACGSCYKLVPISIPQNACPDGYSTKYQSPNDCGANESFSENGIYNGKVCGACEKINKCDYPYRQATTDDSCGLKNFENTTQCMTRVDNCLCYTQLQMVSSVYVGGAGTITPVNKISNKSASCIDENGVTKYQTICQGTPKSKCDMNFYKFISNGCVSTTYNNGFEVKGDEFGDCTRTDCPSGYSTQYQSQKDCQSGETFSSSGKLNDLICGKCEKNEICDYEYRHATKSDTCGITGNLDDGPQCYRSTCCWQYLSKVKSIDTYGGTPNVMPIYNRISNKSATCVKNNVTKYETICEGVAKPECKVEEKKFIPNGCVSDSYNHDFQVIGTEWGTCVCDNSKGFYDNEQECKNTTGKNCTPAGYGCYQTCESKDYYSTEETCKNATGKNCASGNHGCYQTCSFLGLYSSEQECKTATGKNCVYYNGACYQDCEAYNDYLTEEECKNTDYAVTCSKTSRGCYRRNITGFLIQYADDRRRMYCKKNPHNDATYIKATAYLADIDDKDALNPGMYSETIDGNRPSEFPIDSKNGYQYPAGTYYLCFRLNVTLQRYYPVGISYIELLKQNNYNNEHSREGCYSSSIGDLSRNERTSCEKTDTASSTNASIYNDACKKITFEDGQIYKIKFHYNNTSGLYNGSSYSCEFKEVM